MPVVLSSYLYLLHVAVVLEVLTVHVVVLILVQLCGALCSIHFASEVIEV
jgi:hypothetical protein